MKNKVRVKGELSIYLQWPLILSIVLILATMVVAAVNVRAGVIMSVFTSRVCHFIRDESSRNIAFIGAFGGFNQNNATYLECLDLFLQSPYFPIRI